VTLQALPIVPIPAYGANPPASPVDGQEWIFPCYPANSGFWHFRYDAANARWGFLGGQPLTQRGVNVNVASSPNGVWPATGFPSFTIPRSGVYICKYGGSIGDGNGTLAAAQVYCTFQCYQNGTAVDTYSGVMATGTWQAAAAAGLAAFGVSINDIIQLRVSSNVAGKNLTVLQAWMELIPAYVT
jgi:hypothetical protein